MALSQKEKERVRKTHEQLTKMKEAGYKINEQTIGAGFANFMGIVWGFILSTPTILLFINKFGNPLNCPDTFWDFVISQIIYWILIVAHEAIHGVCIYLFNGHNKNTIAFGINSLMPYCTCQTPIKRWQYIIVLLMPTIILGIAISIFALHIGRFWWLLLAFEMMVGGGGDFTIATKILMKKGSGMVVVDHPYKCGFFALSKEYEKDEFDVIAKDMDDAYNGVDEGENITTKQEQPKHKKTTVLVEIALIIVAFWVGWLCGAIFGYEDAMNDVENGTITNESTIASESTDATE